jgi:hypothetical protein
MTSKPKADNWTTTKITHYNIVLNPKPKQPSKMKTIHGLATAECDKVL